MQVFSFSFLSKNKWTVLFFIWIGTSAGTFLCFALLSVSFFWAAWQHLSVGILWVSGFYPSELTILQFLDGLNSSKLLLCDNRNFSPAHSFYCSLCSPFPLLQHGIFQLFASIIFNVIWWANWGLWDNVDSQMSFHQVPTVNWKEFRLPLSPRRDKDLKG